MNDKKYQALKTIFLEFSKSMINDLDGLDPQNHETVKKAWQACGVARATFKMIESGQIDSITDLKARL